MTPERRTTLTRLGLRRKHDHWHFHGSPQIPDAQVDAIPAPAWQALVTRWRRNRVR